MSKLIKSASLALTLVFFVSFVGYSQSSTATLSGTIEDQNSAALPGVTVSVENVGTRIRRTATTNESGSFTIPLLPPGEYTVLVEREGFTRVQLTNIVLNVGDQKAVQVQLKVGDVASTVEVRPDEGLVETSPAVGTVIDRQTVEHIPLNGRSFHTLFALTPGVNLGVGGQITVNGQRSTTNSLTVDGVSGNTAINSNAGAPGARAGGTDIGYTIQGTTASLVNLDALKEFRIQTSSYAPEFGRTPGAQISLVSRSGENKFHGTLFESFRHNVFDAVDWFSNLRGQDPPLRQHQFGGTFGGPVIFPRFGDGGGDWLWKGNDKAFFFFSYEGLRLTQPQSAVARVPSLERRQAAHPEIKPLINAYPIPNGRNLGDGHAEFAASWSNRSVSDSASLRIDYSITPRHTVFGRYSYTPSKSTLRPVTAVNTLQHSTQDNRSFTAGSTWSISDRVANDLRVNLARTYAPFFRQLDTFGGAQLLPSTFFGSGSSPDRTGFTLNFSATSGQSAFLQFGVSNALVQRQFNLVDGLTITIGNHSFKIGGDYRRMSPILRGNGDGSESLSFRLADVSQARAATYTISRSREVAQVVAFDNLSLYAQDTWRATRRLTLTYGLRWEVVPPPHVIEGVEPFTLANIDDPFGGRVHLNPQGTPLWETRYDYFAPRVGASYLLSDKPGKELVVRGAVGIFYDLGYGGAANALGFNYPFTGRRSCPSTPDCPTQGGTSPVIFPLIPSAFAPVDFSARPAAFSAVDPANRLPIVYQWNAAVERSFGSHQTLSVSFVGSEGRRLLKPELLRINLQEWPAPQSPTAVTVGRTLGYSDYRSLQVQFQRRMHRNLQSIISYTFARSRDTSSNDEGGSTVPGQRADINQDFGYSNFDIRHTLSGTFSYQVPKLSGPWLFRTLVNYWGVDTMFIAQTGRPVDVFTGVTFNDPSFPVVEIFNVRPNVVPGQPFWIDDPSAPGGRRLNRLAFSVPPPNTVGDLPRGIIRGFPARQLNVSLRRDFPLREALKLQLRLEVFNVTNTPNFDNPSSNFSATTPASAFGAATQSLSVLLGGGSAGSGSLYQIGGARSVQLSAKLIF